MGDGRFSRSMRVVGRRMSYANVVATLALVVAMGGTAAAAGVLVTSNKQVRHDTISGHHPPSGKHANIISDSIDGTDLSTKFKTSLEPHCATGLQQASSGLCFDPSPRAATDFSTALERCRNANLRLPSVGELAEVFDSTDAFQSYQWTSDWFLNGSAAGATALIQDDSRQLSPVALGENSTVQYRCVGNPTN